MDTILDYINDHGEFEELLDDAENNASTEWEVKFVNNIAEKFDEYEEDMYLSQKQFDKLQNIAKWD